MSSGNGEHAGGLGDHRDFEGSELSTALRTAGVGIWTWNVADDVARWSPETARMFGLPPETFVGTLEDFVTRVHPDDRARVEAAMEQLLAAGESGDIELRVDTRDGSTRWISTRGRILRDAAGRPLMVVGAAIDITAEHLRREELQQSQEAYRLFSELASDYVYQVDVAEPLSVPRIIAGSFERTTGYSPEEVGEKGGWLAIIHPDDRTTIPDVMDALRAGRPLVYEYRILTKGGEERWLRDRVQPVLDPQTKVLRQVVGGVQDITERKRLEIELNHAQRLEALAHLAGSVAHDFNNLLTVMMAESDSIARSLSSRDAAPDFAPLRDAFARAAELTSSLLAFARSRPSPRENVRLSDVLAGVRPLIERAVGEQVGVIVEDAAGDALVAVDRPQLDAALLNLAINARDAMPDGGQLQLSTGVLALPVEGHGPVAGLAPGTYGTIALRDTGTGMPPETLARVFEPYFTTKEGVGAGLGLSTVHGVIRQLGGAVLADSTPGQGTTFTIHLPLARGAVGEVQPERSLPSIGGTERIVLVEDDPTVCRTLARILTDLGYRVASFGSVEEALGDADALATADLVLTDLRLPGRSGIDLAEHCRSAHPRLRVLLMSGYVEDPAHASVIESGELPFMHKPIDPEVLARRIRDLLDA